MNEVFLIYCFGIAVCLWYNVLVNFKHNLPGHTMFKYAMWASLSFIGVFLIARNERKRL